MLKKGGVHSSISALIRRKRCKRCKRCEQNRISPLLSKSSGLKFLIDLLRLRSTFNSDMAQIGDHIPEAHADWPSPRRRTACFGQQDIGDLVVLPGRACSPRSARLRPGNSLPGRGRPGLGLGGLDLERPGSPGLQGFQGLQGLRGLDSPRPLAGPGRLARPAGKGIKGTCRNREEHWACDRGIRIPRPRILRGQAALQLCGPCIRGRIGRGSMGHLRAAWPVRVRCGLALRLRPSLMETQLLNGRRLTLGCKKPQLVLVSNPALDLLRTLSWAQPT
mmetsp:Transcript_47825/g.104101  ORF Transcript_47825/g.104101 Transcript_47825/m.104101 type:complete len:277 (+) Transcript_47825:80-910(+)